MVPDAVSLLPLKRCVYYQLNGFSYSFKQTFRIDPETYDSLEHDLGPVLEQQGSTNGWTLTVRQRLRAFLSYMATNSVYWAVKNMRGMSTSSVYNQVHTVTDAILDTLHGYVQLPDTDYAREIAMGFSEMVRNKFPPIIIGVIDGTFVSIKKPREFGAAYWTRKFKHCLNVLVMMDYRGRILAINPRGPGRIHDEATLEDSDFFGIYNSGDLPFSGAQVAGDPGYCPRRPWLLTAFPESVKFSERPADRPKKLYNEGNS